MAYLHTDMERFDVHVAFDVCERFAADTAASTVCEMVVESATFVANLDQMKTERFGEPPKMTREPRVFPGTRG